MKLHQYFAMLWVQSFAMCDYAQGATPVCCCVNTVVTAIIVVDQLCPGRETNSLNPFAHTQLQHGMRISTVSRLQSLQSLHIAAAHSSPLSASFLATPPQSRSSNALGMHTHCPHIKPPERVLYKQSPSPCTRDCSKQSAGCGDCKHCTTPCLMPQPMHTQCCQHCLTHKPTNMNSKGAEALYKHSMPLSARNCSQAHSSQPRCARGKPNQTTTMPFMSD